MKTYKLLVNAPSGKQEIIEIAKSGGYFDEKLIVWDERTQGELPGDALAKLDAEKQAEADATAKLIAEKQKEQADRRERLRQIDKASSVGELKALLKDIAAEMGV